MKKGIPCKSVAVSAAVSSPLPQTGKQVLTIFATGINKPGRRQN